MKKTKITDINGQNDTYLRGFLLSEGYKFYTCRDMNKWMTNLSPKFISID